MEYYHISVERKLRKLTLTPRVPKSRMDDEDPFTKRICVSSSVAGCIKALELDGCIIDLHLYRVKNYSGRVKRPTESEVPDVRKTKEKWLLDPCELEYLGLIHDNTKCSDHVEWKWIKQVA